MKGRPPHRRRKQNTFKARSLDPASSAVRPTSRCAAIKKEQFSILVFPISQKKATLCGTGFSGERFTTRGCCPSQRKSRRHDALGKLDMSHLA